MSYVPFTTSQLLDKAEYCLRAAWRPYLSKAERYRFIMKAWRYIEQERHTLHGQIWPGAPYRRLASERRIRITHCIFTGHRLVAAEYGHRHLHIIEFCLAHGWNEKTPEEVFSEGWHFDTFERFLWQAINWDKMHIRCLNEMNR